MQAVEARIEALKSPSSTKQLKARADRVNQAATPKQRQQLVEQAFKASGAAKKLFWLRREAEVVSKAILPHSACRKGCSDCCSINVMLTEGEARVIAKAIGRPISEPAPGKALVPDNLVTEAGMNRLQQEKASITRDRIGQPCTFLEAERCSIYEHRPMACRQQFNLDDDNLLCKLVEGGDIPVPYLNQQPAQAAYLMLWGFSSRMADIREWFPATSGTKA
jgi:Fe-S-cluster containining protein